MQAAYLKGDDGGKSVTYTPENTFMAKRRDQGNQEAQSFQVMNVLFADDATHLCQEPQMEKAKNSAKTIISLFEEKTNDAKEENIILGGSAPENFFPGR